MLAMKSASRYLQELVSLGVLREMSFGREKLFVHPKLMSLLINDSNEFDLYVSSPTTRFKRSDKAQKPAKILRSSGFLCFIGFLRIVFWCSCRHLQLACLLALKRAHTKYVHNRVHIFKSVRINRSDSNARNVCHFFCA